MSSANTLKHASLGMLALQNLAVGLIMPLCRKPDAMGNVFFAPTCVVVMELLKMLVAYIGLTWKHYDAQRQLRSNNNVYLPIANEDESRTPSSSTLNDDYAVDMNEKDAAAYSSSDEEEESLKRSPSPVNVAVAPTGSLQDCARMSFNDVWHVGALRMAVPSLLYVVQNNLQIFSAGYLTPGEFQVFSQMKLITTAVFLVLLLKRKLTAQHWLCILALCLGIILVKGADDLLNGFQASSLSSPGLWAIGFPAILGASICSGLAGVYLEMQLKGKQCFWASNVQLAGFSLLPAMAPVVLDCYRRGAIDPFRYFTPLVWAMILTNVAGGILVAMVIKYADNILKGFAVSVSLILTIIVSAFITGVPLTAYQLIGGSVVAASTFVYGQTKAAPQ